jgi:hypothetical protein
MWMKYIEDRDPANPKKNKIKESIQSVRLLNLGA